MPLHLDYNYTYRTHSNMPGIWHRCAHCFFLVTDRTAKKQRKAIWRNEWQVSESGAIVRKQWLSRSMRDTIWSTTSGGTQIVTTRERSRVPRGIFDERGRRRGRQASRKWRVKLEGKRIGFLFGQRVLDASLMRTTCGRPNPCDVFVAQCIARSKRLGLQLP